MNKKNVKKSALLTSVLALLLCVSMLVGTTFAWFTDEVVSGMNTIAAGNLDIELYHTSASVTTEEPVNNGTTLFLDVDGQPIKWEPGVVSYETLKVANVGTLALNYDLVMNFGNENDLNGNKLSQILKIGIVPAAITSSDRAAVIDSVDEANWTTLDQFLKSGSLLPAGVAGDSETMSIVIWWEPSDEDNNWNVNNGQEVSDYAETKVNELHIDLGVKLTATQMMYEKDSFDETYDKDATPVKVATLSELNNALKSGAKNIDAGGANLGDFYYDAQFTDGATIQNAKFTYFYGGNVTGTVVFENCEFVSDHSYSANFDSGNGNIIFNNCLFDGWSSFGTAITGVEFNKCTFQKTGPYGILRFYQNAVLNECVFDASFEGIDTNVTGTVVEFNGCTGIEGKIHNNGSNVGVWIVDGEDISASVTSW